MEPDQGSSQQIAEKWKEVGTVEAKVIMRCEQKTRKILRCLSVKRNAFKTKQSVFHADILNSDGSVFFNGLSSLGSTLVFIHEGRRISTAWGTG